MSKHIKKFYCAFCRVKRKINTKKSVTFVEVLFCLFASIVLMFLFFQKPDFRVLGFFAVLLMFTEVFLQLKWRLTISCPHCGFDPVLYLKNNDKAVQKVKDHLEKRKSDPAYVLRSQKLDLPRRVIKKEKSSATLPSKPIQTKGSGLDLSL